MSQSPVDDSSAGYEIDPTLTRYQSGWNKLNEMLRNGGSLSGREQNCCYLNLGSTAAPRFSDISHVSGFDAPVDGRGLALADWDRDGDLDVWTTNRTGPRVQYFRNDTQPKRRFLSLRLQGTKSNRDAIGARVEVEVEPTIGVLSRTVTAGDAYLSQSSKWLHFGLAESQKITTVRVRWPGAREFATVAGVTLDGEFHVVEGEGTAIRRAISRKAITTSDTLVAKEKNETAHELNKMTVVGRLPLPPIELQFEGRKTATLTVGRPTMVLLWSPQCPICLQELSDWSQRIETIRKSGLEVVAVSAAGDPASLQLAQNAIEQTQFPYSWASAQPPELELIEAYLGFLQQDYQRSLGVPMSLLVDRYGQVAVVYRGAVSVDEVLNDMSVLDQLPDEVRRTRLPYSGKWLRPLVRPDPTDLATQLSHRFSSHAAIDYFEHLIQIADQEPRSVGPYSISTKWNGQALRALGTILLSEGRFAESASYSSRAQKLLPTDFQSFANQGAALLKLGLPKEALAALNKALELRPDRPSVLVNRASLYRQMGRHREAIHDWEALLRINPDDERSRLAAAAVAFATGDDRRAVTHYSEHLRRNPDSTDAAGALAWILATSHDAGIRDGTRAVALATMWSTQSGGQDYKALNALAAAFAEIGDFANAVATIDRAIELARLAGDFKAVTAYRPRRKSYRDRAPFRRKKPIG